MNWKLFQVNIVWLWQNASNFNDFIDLNNYINAVNLTNECTALVRIDQSKMGNTMPELMEMQNRAEIFIFDREVQIKYEHVLHIIKQSMEINILMLARVYLIHATSDCELEWEKLKYYFHRALQSKSISIGVSFN